MRKLLALACEKANANLVCSRTRARPGLSPRVLDKIEEKGPHAGALLDTRLKIYEMKSKRPPIRLYYKYNLQTDEINIHPGEHLVEMLRVQKLKLTRKFSIKSKSKFEEDDSKKEELV